MGNAFVEEGKKILRDGKILKGIDAEENFNTELNELTFELEVLYPMDYQEFKKEFPNTIELVSTVEGNGVLDAVKNGIVIEGWYEKNLVQKIISNIKENIQDPERQEELVQLRTNVMNEIKRMKDDFDIEWSADLFFKCWKIKEGELVKQELESAKGEKLAEKRIQTLKDIGGLEFLAKLQNEIYE